MSEDTPAEIEVKPGLKTVYVFASNKVVDLAVGESMADFEKKVFSSNLSDLKTSKGFVMVGKSEAQQVLVSANESEIPASNVFNIEMVRLVAKTQVKVVQNLDASSFGFTVGKPTFRVSQTCGMMRLVADYDNDLQASYLDSDGDGTYDGYSVGGDLQFLNTVTDNFTATGCHYLSENIVKDPVAGNTTFVSLCIPFTPESYYTYDEDRNFLSNTLMPGEVGKTFYAIGIVDRKYGLEDFVLDPENKHVVVFKGEYDAENYKNALNGGSASAITVSETESPLGAPSANYDVNVREFSVVEFTGGKAYYRINIANADKKMMVERNKFYKIAVNSVRALGYHSEELLRPLEPESDPGNSTSAWIATVLSVAPWEEVDQPTDL